ncbi:cyclin N-terminal domain-containing protein 1-like [Dendronephthya gigantea]|uniref:cyclin N-terminal domain-containing protein 1-like n=1 Tax=Dendronephthya gigantea TaxID=151771 RepID=UPI00106BB2BD|nr:cyclin N-terminal domain-containing protein 1-like [Dendronephthya gigantea]
MGKETHSKERFSSPLNLAKLAKTRIFGTPSEPLFNDAFGLPPSLLEDSLQTLAEINERNMDNADKDMGYFKNAKCAEYIFNLCDALTLPVEARYLAVEIYDRFMIKHIVGLYQFIQTSSGMDKQKDWNEVENRIKVQMPLRLLSCVQLASKLSSHCKALSASKVRRYLSSMNHHFSNNSILKSELRILKTLDHCLPVHTPLTYIETLLEILGFNAGTQVKFLYEISIKLLDLVYILHEEIYTKLLLVATGETRRSAEHRHKLAVLSSDFMLMASAVISAAGFIVDEQASDGIASHLSNITQIPEADILDFATIVVERAIQDQ